MSRFCVRCGREESDKVKLIGYLCVDCFLREKDIASMPKRISLEVCPSCGSIKLGDTWYSSEDFGNDLRIPISYIVSGRLRPGSDLVTGVRISNINIVKTNERIYAEIEVEGFYKDIKLAKTYLTEILILRRLCPLCTAAKTGSFEALIQIRGFPKLSETKRKMILRYIDSLPQDLKNNISGIDHVKNGINLRMITKKVAENLANNIAKEFKGFISYISEENIKTTSSGRTSRRVISLRIIDLEENDYININGKPYTIEKILDKGVFAKDRDGRRVFISIEELIRSIKVR